MDSVKGRNDVPQNNEEPAPPGTEIPLPLEQEPSTPISTPKTPKVLSSVKGVENAKKRLRAFSIQKKTPITPIILPKSSGSGNATVLIGKLSSVKLTPKVEDPEHKKLPKPPKPGTSRKSLQDSYTDLQRRTLAEIEDMKRKMELVELGIPLGLICPSSTSEKAMPTKAMPPIKSFLDPAKVDDLIREAKKAKLEGKEFKFDYHKLLPDYDNPFQRKREEAASHEKDRKSDRRKGETDKDRRKSDKYDSRRHDYKKDEMKYKERDRDKFKDKGKGKEEKIEESRKIDKAEKETDLNLNDYLICDSWSLDNDDKHSISSPKVQEKPSNFVASLTPSSDITVTEPSEQLKLSISKNKEILRNITLDKPLNAPKMEKLQPVIDSFKFEIDPNDDEILDIFDEDSGLEKYAQTKSKKQSLLYDPSDKSVHYGADISKDTSLDGINDDTFLESVINEIKQEDMSDDGSQDKGLVEYEISPNREEESPRKTKAGSVTPEIIDKSRAQSRSDFSEGYRSSDSFKTSDTNESGYKSIDSYRISIEKELDDALESKMSKSTVDSLETWNFVLKICQPLLFRHDKKKCYKETRTTPKIWYTESPKGCSCVKDRSVVYEELEMSKMNLVDRVYGCDHCGQIIRDNSSMIADSLFSSARGWYPRHSLCPTESSVVPLANEWEAEDSLQAHRTEERMSATPQRNDELSLDREYQRFMEAVWPDVVDSKIETSRSTTPVRQESRKKKKEDVEKETEDKKSKKIKLSSECWSQESDLDEEHEKSNKAKVEKDKSRSRKRKHSTSSMSSSLSDSDEISTKKRKLLKKKAIKKTKSKSAKRRRMGRKILKKLKEKQNKRKHNKSSDEDSDKKKDKRIKKKKQEKLKKKAQKKKKVVQTSSSSSSSSSDSSSESDSASDRRSKKAKKRNQERRKKTKKQRKPSSSDSTQSEDLFDVNILNNIKTERLTDDEKSKKLMEFSPRRQKPREIINVKELQNDFVENIHIKKEVEEDLCKEVRKEVTDKIQSDVFDIGSLEPVTETSAIEEIELPEDPPMKNTLAPPTVGHHGGRVEAPAPDESNMSQCSSQESVCSVKDVPSYEKDESHLRPSSQNSNYSFNDVISASQNVLYQKGIETVAECDDKYTESYETANYEMYEQLAMAYQSDVASQRACAEAVSGGGERRIETVVRARCGEIKCDWRPGRAPAPPPAPRPSRWGLKPGEVNIVLTGEGTHFPVEEAQPIYQIQSIANRTDSNANTGYDEAYMDMYGAADRLQYGDCFGPDFDTTVSANISVTSIDDISLDTNVSAKANVETRTSSLDDRINKALRETVLGEVAKEVECVDPDKDVPEKGILITNVTTESRSSKRVSFADGYKPGQDSDVEEPPVKKRKKARRYGCAWPCPAAHADHVPLWDALPPPPPPPGSPPPPARAAPPAHLLRAARRRAAPPALPALPAGKFDPSIPLPGFMPPEPPPGLISLQ